MAKRTLAIGDIHGGLRALEQVLDRASIQEEDRLFFLGDYVDGWSESPAVIDKLIALNYSHKCIFLRGNHDDLLYRWLSRGDDNPLWLTHGGQSSVSAYQCVSEETKKRHLAFLEGLDNYYIDHKNRLFVHAGFTNLNGVSREYHQEMLYWDRSLWELALALDKSLMPEDTFYPDRLKLYSEIYVGHNPTTRLGKDLPLNYGPVWNLDTGAAYTGKLTVMDIDTKEFWQSDPLISLYPEEKGRN